MIGQLQLARLTRFYHPHVGVILIRRGVEVAAPLFMDLRIFEFSITTLVSYRPPVLTDNVNQSGFHLGFTPPKDGAISNISPRIYCEP